MLSEKARKITIGGGSMWLTINCYVEVLRVVLSGYDASKGLILGPR